MALLIHLPTASDWRRFSDRRRYSPQSLSTEGFIHLARATEAVMVANLLFQATDTLLVVAIDSRRLDTLRLDADRPGGFAWPHLHGDLSLSAVLAEFPYPKLPGGRYGPLASRLAEFDAGPQIEFHDPIGGAECLCILDALTEVGCDAVLDGGWAVDAVLGNDRRHHGDLDLCIADHSVAPAIGALNRLGFEVMEDQLPTRVELRSRGGHGPQVDLHPVTFDAAGNGAQTLADGGAFTYPAAGLAGRGTINDRVVRCLTPELQLECHLGYEPDDDDYADVANLCRRFGLAPPGLYAEALGAVVTHD